MRPAGGVAGRRPARGALPRPVSDLAPELHVGHAVVARRDPAVDGRRRQVHRAAVARRHLLGRQPPAQAVPYRLQPGRRGRLVGVYPAPGRDEDRVRRRLRGPGAGRRRGGGACSRLTRGTGRSRCSIAATRPGAGRPPTGRRRRPRARRAPGLRRRHEPVRRHLGAHRRGRPAQLPRDLPARRPALQHPLDRVPLVPREPSVGPRDRPCGAPFSSFRTCRPPISRGGRSGPQGIGLPHSSAHVRMNVGGVRIKLIIKVYDIECISKNVFSILSFF